MMQAFRWDQCFVTGLPAVDEQHHRLVDLVNRFGDGLTTKEGASAEQIQAVFLELAAYAQHHFREEESLMAGAGVDSRHTVDHRRSHAEFLRQVVQMRAAITPERPKAAGNLHQFLRHWLVYHILGTDQSMARQVAAIGAGRSPAEAFEGDRHTDGRATQPLLHALDGLFHQVSERNCELVHLNQTLEEKVRERTQQLEDAANTDVLTGLPNRRHAMRRFEVEWRASLETGAPLACMVVDADHFKQINDTHGHDAGDEVLRCLSRQLRYGVRTDDIVCRLGGDEFLVLCPATPLEGAMHLAEQMRLAVAELRVPVGDGAWNGSISVGVSARREGMTSLEDLLKVADEGVYVAKRAGRNAVATVLPRRPSEMPRQSLRSRARAAT